jgi:hypothetical protein
MSAAALALGGEFVSSPVNLKYGVHRFALNDTSSRAADDTQVLAASVVEYIRSIEVDVEWFSLASVAENDCAYRAAVLIDQSPSIIFAKREFLRIGPETFGDLRLNVRELRARRRNRMR